MGEAAEQIEDFEEENEQGEAANDGEVSRREWLLDQDMAALLEQCRKAVDKISTKESKRSEINAGIKAEREKLEALGITKKALSLAGQVAKMTEDQRDGFFLSLQIMLKAIDCPIKQDELQLDMFE